MTRLLIEAAALALAFAAGCIYEGTRSGGTLDLHERLALSEKRRVQS